MAPILRDRGMDGIDAGLVVSVSIIVQVFTCLLVPPLAMRCKDQRLLNAALALIAAVALIGRSEEHTSELQSLMRISYAVFCLKKKKKKRTKSSAAEDRLIYNHDDVT